MEKITVNICQDNKDKIETLQIVRVIAFLGIFLSHCGVIALGEWGVSIFFVLSGFVLTYSHYYDEQEVTVAASVLFSKRKISKLYPLHIIMMIAAIVFSVYDIYVNTSVDTILFHVVALIFNILLLQTLVPEPEFSFSFNGVAWYLSVSMFLYAAFPFILSKVKKIREKYVLGVVFLIYTILIFLGLGSQCFFSTETVYDNFSYWFTYICPFFRMGDFIIGCCFGRLFLERKFEINLFWNQVMEIVAVIATVLALYIYTNRVGILGSEGYRYSLLFTPISVLIVYSFAGKKGILAKVLKLRPILYLAELSPYMFLIHQIVISYIGVFSKRIIGIEMKKAVLVIIAFSITMFASELYKRLREWETAHRPTC